MKYELAKKAYQIDFSRIEEGYCYDSYRFVVYADTRNKAKTLLMKKAYCESICLDGEDDEVTYLTIPVIRYKEVDKFKFEDKELSLYEIDELLSKRKRIEKLNEILNNENIKFCYIRKGSYYRPNSSGYTDFKHKAGVYPKKEAFSHAISCSDISLEIIDIDKHNQMLKDEVVEIESRFLI